MEMAVKYRKSLWPEQVERRVGKRIWVSKVGLQFWPDITRGSYRTIRSVEHLNRSGKPKVVCFADGSRLLMSELGTVWVAFDTRPQRNETPCCAETGPLQLRDAYAMVHRGAEKGDVCYGD